MAQSDYGNVSLLSATYNCAKDLASFLVASASFSGALAYGLFSLFSKRNFFIDGLECYGKTFKLPVIPKS